MPKIVLNKEAKQDRIDSVIKHIVNEVKFKAEKGVDRFTVNDVGVADSVEKEVILKTLEDEYGIFLSKAEFNAEYNDLKFWNLKLFIRTE